MKNSYTTQIFQVTNKKKPENDHTLIIYKYENHPMGLSEAYEYVPAEHNPIMTRAKNIKKYMDYIVTRIPKIEFSSMLRDNQEFPMIFKKDHELIGLDYHCKREIFSIGGRFFFRRYNDWNYQVNFSKRANDTFCDYVAWVTSVGPNFLKNLALLLEKKDPSDISPEEIDEILYI